MIEAERFWAKVQKGPGCWLWMGSLSSKDPNKAYGTLHDKGKSLRASRIAWELANGKPFPSERMACHTCDNPRCVNPEHIYPGTARDNALDAIHRGRQHFPNRTKTHCVRGHPFSGDNFYFDKDGERVCRACKRIRKYKSRATKRRERINEYA